MATLSKYVTYETCSGRPHKIGDAVVTPISRVLILALPFYNLVWNRPVAVIVEQGDTTKKLPIVNITLLVQSAAVIIGLSTTILTLIARRAAADS
jgi:hypothetical protein